MDLYRSATTDEFGRFHVQDIAPGRPSKSPPFRFHFEC
jgi:hypothetical protein